MMPRNPDWGLWALYMLVWMMLIFIIALPEKAEEPKCCCPAAMRCFDD